MPFILSYPIRILVSRKHRTTAVIIGIALSVSLPIVVGLSFDSAVGALFTDLTRSVPDDVRLTLPPMPNTTASAQLSDFISSSKLKHLDFSLRYSFRSFVRSNSSETLASVVALNCQNDWFLLAIDLKTGNFTNLGGNRVLVSQSLARDLHLELGKNFEIINRKTRLNVQVCGVFNRLGYEDEKEIILSLGWLHSSWNTTEVDEAGIIWTGKTMDVDEYPSFVSTLLSELESYFGHVNVRLERRAILERERVSIDIHRRAMELILLFSLLAGTTSTIAFLVLSYHEQLYELSLLKVIGMKKHQLFLPPIVMTLILVLCGTVLGICVSLFVSIVLRAFNALFFPVLVSGVTINTSAAQGTLRMQPQSLIRPIAIQLILSLFAATYPAVRSARTPCVFGLRPRARHENNRAKAKLISFVSGIGLVVSVVLSRMATSDAITIPNKYAILGILYIIVICFGMLFFVGLVSPLSHVSKFFAHWLKGLELVLRKNLTHNKLRTWAISGQFGITVLVILSFSIMSGFIGSNAVSGAYLANGSDIVLSGYYQSPDVSRVPQINGVEMTATFMYFDLAQTSVNATTAIQSVGEIRSLFINPVNYSQACRWEKIGIVAQTWLSVLPLLEENPNSTIISKNIANALGISADENVVIEIGIPNEITVLKAVCRVLAIVDVMPGIGKLYNPLAVLSEQLLPPDVKEMGFIGDKMLVKTVDSADIHEVAEEIDYALSDSVFSVSITEELVDDFLKKWATITLTYEFLAAFSLILAGVTLTVILLTAIMDRRFEFGILQASGATQITPLIVAEALTIGVSGFLMGSVLTIILWITGALGVTSLGSIAITTIGISTLSVFLLVLGISFGVGRLSSRYIESKTPATNLRQIIH